MKTRSGTSYIGDSKASPAKSEPKLEAKSEGKSPARRSARGKAQNSALDSIAEVSKSKTKKKKEEVKEKAVVKTTRKRPKECEDNAKSEEEVPSKSIKKQKEVEKTTKSDNQKMTRARQRGRPKECEKSPEEAMVVEEIVPKETEKVEKTRTRQRGRQKESEKTPEEAIVVEENVQKEDLKKEVEKKTRTRQRDKPKECEKTPEEVIVVEENVPKDVQQELVKKETEKVVEKTRRRQREKPKEYEKLPEEAIVVEEIVPKEVKETEKVVEKTRTRQRGRQKECEKTPEEAIVVKENVEEEDSKNEVEKTTRTRQRDKPKECEKLPEEAMVVEENVQKDVQQEVVEKEAEKVVEKTNIRQRDIEKEDEKTYEELIVVEENVEKEDIKKEVEKTTTTSQREKQKEYEKTPEEAIIVEENIKSDVMKEDVIPVKRKSEDLKSDEEVPSKSSHEPIKRLKVSRFSVPSIPQICGQLYSFGDDIAGELGLRLKQYKESKLKKNEPSFVTDSDGQPIDNIVSVVCGAIHSCCLTFEGKVVTFGCNDDSALGRDTQTNSDQTDDSIEIDDSEETAAKTPKVVAGLPEVVKVTAGDMHTCVLTKEGHVYIWGNFKDESKKLGLFLDSVKEEDSDDFFATPLPRKVELETKIVDIASGCHHILLLTEDGDVLSFGDGSIGQLGRIREEQLSSVLSDRKLFLEPKKVELDDHVVVERVWANHWSSYAKTSSGDILCWGLNNNNQLGFKSESCVRVANPDANQSQAFQERIVELRPKKADQMPANVVMIANGQHHMLALDADGNVFACGCNLYGKLGIKSEGPPESPQMISREAFDGHKVKYVACGEFCSLAITDSGHLMTWGQGALQIGVMAQDGNFPDLEVPTRLRGLLADETRFVSVASGSQHTLVIGNKSSINGN